MAVVAIVVAVLVTFQAECFAFLEQVPLSQVAAAPNNPVFPPYPIPWSRQWRSVVLPRQLPSEPWKKDKHKGRLNSDPTQSHFWLVGTHWCMNSRRFLPVATRQQQHWAHHLFKLFFLPTHTVNYIYVVNTEDLVAKFGKCSPDLYGCLRPGWMVQMN